MKSHPEITNPWALAWYMADKGDKPHEAEGQDAGLALIQKWEDFEKSPEYQAYCEKYGEANSASSMGQLQRPAKKESTRGVLSFAVRIRETDGPIDDGAREVQVLIIKEGMGNRQDRHFYSAQLLARVAPLFDGVKAYADHPSKTEESDRPERSVRDIVGFYHSPKIVMVEGRSAIQAILKINGGQAYDWAWNLVKEAAAFAKKFKDKDLVGISINAWGTSHPVEAADGVVNMVDDLNEVQSADIVTQAGAGGGFRLREAIKKVLVYEGQYEGGKPMDMASALKKHGEGLAAMRAQVGKDPAHEKVYGPALDAMMAHHGELTKAMTPAGDKGGESEAGKPGAGGAADSSSDDGVEEKKEAERKAAEEMASFEKMSERYKAGKMTATEKVIFEALANHRAETKVKENAQMVERVIRESAIPAAYADDLPVLCAGKSEADVKRLVESRKKLVAPLLGNKATGAGAGAAGDEKKSSKLQEKLAAAGVSMKASK